MTYSELDIPMRSERVDFERGLETGDEGTCELILSIYTLNQSFKMIADQPVAAIFFRRVEPVFCGEIKAAVEVASQESSYVASGPGEVIPVVLNSKVVVEPCGN